MQKRLDAGKPLQTADGRLILQHCRHSAMDTWDHLALCAVDIYDISGDPVRYVETREAYPDLAALATIIDLAHAHERQGLIGYVATPALADTLIDAGLPTGGDEVDVTKNPDGSEDVVMGWAGLGDPQADYTLARRDGSWIVTGYQPVPPDDGNPAAVAAPLSNDATSPHRQ